MTIDVSVPGSDGWYMDRLSKRLNADRKRFKILTNYRQGRPPLVWGSENVKARFYKFQQTSRTNYAALVVEAMVERMALRSVSTAAQAGAEGDPRAWELVQANDLDISFEDAADLACTYGRSYLMTASPAEDDNDDAFSVIAYCDPRDTIAERDSANPRKNKAAFRIFHDDEAGLDVAILWRPGRKVVAVRENASAPVQRRSAGLLGVPDFPEVSFSAAGFSIRPTAPEGASDPWWSEEYDSQDVPVRTLKTRNEVGVFELHTDLLDRLNHVMLMQMVIVTMQAFRQRQLEQSTDENVEQLPEYDESGNKIDYSDLFELGPDSLLLPPPGAKISELGQADLTGIQSFIKADLLTLSAVTHTPMTMFTPDAAAQTAEGASLQREGLVFKVNSFLRSASRELARAIALAFDFMGDVERSDPSKTVVQFAPVDLYSLSEKASAASQVSGTLTWEQTQQEVWQQTPAQIAAAKVQRQDDLVLAQQQALLTAAAAAQQPTRAPASNTRPDGFGGDVKADKVQDVRPNGL